MRLESTARVVPLLAVSTTAAIADRPEGSAWRTAERKSTPGRTATVNTLAAPTSNSLCTARLCAATAQPLMPNTVSPTARLSSITCGANSRRRATRRVASPNASLWEWEVERKVDRRSGGRSRAPSMPRARASNPGAKAAKGSAADPPVVPETPAVASSTNAAPAIATPATSATTVPVENLWALEPPSAPVVASTAASIRRVPRKVAATPTSPVAIAAPIASRVSDVPTPDPKRLDAPPSMTSQATRRPTGTAATTIAVGSIIATAMVLRCRKPRMAASRTSGSRSAAVRAETKYRT